MAILRNQSNLDYLPKEIETEIIKLKGSKSADFHVESNTNGDRGI